MYIQSETFYQAIEDRLQILVDEPKAWLLMRYQFEGVNTSLCAQLWAGNNGQATYELRIGNNLDTAIIQQFSRKKEGVEHLFKQLDRLLGRMIQNEAYDLDLLEGSACHLETVLAPKEYEDLVSGLVWTRVDTVYIPDGFRLQYLNRLNPPVLK